MLGDGKVSSRVKSSFGLTLYSFSETEAVAILAMLVSRYKVEVKEEPQFAGESFEERKERILRAKRGVTLT